MRVVSLVKAPSERLVHKVDLAGRATGLIASNVVARGLVGASSEVTQEIDLEEGNPVFSLSGGSDGEVYAVSAQVIFSDGAERDVSLELLVLDGEWTMPDGGAAMLSISDFVLRIGRDQVLRLTDMGDGRMDKGLIINALRDAQAQAEAYLAARYALPFAQVPVLVAAIVADLAFANLFIDELPDNVAEKRRIAMRNLEAIRKGDLRLGVEALAQTAAPADPVKFVQGERAYPDNLKGYGFR